MDFNEKNYISILKVYYRNGGNDVVIYYSKEKNIDDMLRDLMKEQYMFANKIKDYTPIMINIFDIRSIEEVSTKKRYRKWILGNI